MLTHRHRIEVFELMSNTDLRRIDELVNTPGVIIEKAGDFFGVVQGGDGEPGSATISRVLEYLEPVTCPTDQRGVYKPPMA